MIAVLARDEAGNQAKRGKRQKYVSFTPEYRAAIGRYAAVACSLCNSQSLELQSGLYIAIRNCLKPDLRQLSGEKSGSAKIRPAGLVPPPMGQNKLNYTVTRDKNFLEKLTTSRDGPVKGTETRKG